MNGGWNKKLLRRALLLRISEREVRDRFSAKERLAEDRLGVALVFHPSIEFAAQLTSRLPASSRALFRRVLVYLRDVLVLMRRSPDSPAFLLACRVEELMYRLRVPRQALLDTCRAASPWLTLQTGCGEE